MGERVDRAALWLLFCGGCFAFFLYGTKNIWLAALCTFALCVLARQGLRKLGGPFFRRRRDRRNRARLAEEIVSAWAYLPAAEALAALREVCAQAVLLQNHPQGAPTDANELLALWRAHRGREALTVGSTGRFSDRAKLLADELAAPRLLLRDHRALAKLVAETLPEGARPKTKKRRNPLPALAMRAANGKNALYSLLFLALYGLLRIPAYLAAALFLAGLCAAGYHLRGKRPT